MGLINWIKNKFIEKEVRNKIENLDADKISMMVDAYLKQTMQKHSETLKVAGKLNKANLIQMQEKELRRELREGLADDVDDEEENEGDDEDSDDIDTQVEKFVVNSLLQKLNPQSLTPIAQPSMIEGLRALTKDMSPEEIEDLKQRFMKAK